MPSSQENIDRFMDAMDIGSNSRKRKMELAKMGSAGSTDSDLSEDSSSASWNGDKDSGNDLLEPTSQLLITNMDSSIFSNQEVTDLFESIIRKYDPNFKIFYFKSFSRSRVDLDSIETACHAKKEINGMVFGEKALKCFFFRDLLVGRRNSDHLELPPRDKQFLISPPASPPVGWEPVHECDPIIDLNLIAALASLQPGDTHELHPGAQEKNIPSIVLLPCHDAEDDEELTSNAVCSSSDVESDSDHSGHHHVTHRRSKIPLTVIQTRRPPMTMGSS